MKERILGTYKVIPAGARGSKVRVNGQALAKLARDGVPDRILVWVGSSCMAVTNTGVKECIVKSDERDQMLALGERNIVYSGGQPYVSIPPMALMSLGIGQGDMVDLIAGRDMIVVRASATA